jgi:hypothetical protein
VGVVGYGLVHGSIGLCDLSRALWQANVLELEGFCAFGL